MRLPSREWVIEQLTKNVWARLAFWSGLAILGLIGDEWLKEGHPFSPTDITNPFSHEFWSVVMAIICLCSARKAYVEWRRAKTQKN